MTFQAYLDNIKAKTGKTPEDFRKEAAKKGLTEYREIMAWLKSDFELGHGHANAIAQLLVKPEARKAKPEDRIAKLFTGKKEPWRKTYDSLLVKLVKVGPDSRMAATDTYISLLRGDKKFGVVRPSSAERFDIGIQLKGMATTDKIEAAVSWNNMVTHRVSITNHKQIDAEVLAWLKQAYNAAK